MARVALQEIGSLLLRRSTPALSKQSPLISKRALSSTSAQHEDEEETAKWRNLTIAGYVLCTALGIYNFAGGHEEHEERKEYSYMRIRNKEFPWGPDGLLEYHNEHH